VHGCGQAQDGLVNKHERERRAVIETIGIGLGMDEVDHKSIARERRRQTQRARAFIGALGLACLVLAGCGADPNDTFALVMPHGVAPSGGSAVNGLLDEWSVRTDVDTVHAGPVTFTFSNIGTTTHEMLVTRTDIAPGNISIDPSTSTFNEDDPTSKVLDEISETDAGKTGSVTINLTPGNYQLLCNVPGHYTKGMYTRFTVTP